MRKWLSFKLVSCAYKLYPRNPKVTEFYANVIRDQMITGQSVLRIDPLKMYKEREVVK